MAKQPSGNATAVMNVKKAKLIKRVTDTKLKSDIIAERKMEKSAAR